jgi:hypothetical protein
MFGLISGHDPTAMPQLIRYIGIDYSGAETPDSSRRGLRVFMAEGSGTPGQVLLPSLDTYRILV